MLPPFILEERVWVTAVFITLFIAVDGRVWFSFPPCCHCC